jgi:hypothetical protein
MFKLQPISEFIVRVVELLEAEGRTLRSAVAGEAARAHSAVVNLATGMAFLLVALPMIVGGLSLLAVGLMWWLETQVSRPLAAVLTGLACLAVGGGCLWGFRMIVAPAKRLQADPGQTTVTGTVS